ncbi:PrgH/EprH family type III secretion apparatus protein [Chromobacterium piscinae]|uniref:PrgH/EprH family type III secretion apparatus protein n=1 Tax=Chromobacterium piscinae TaxID=686831 RepID=A0ABV0HDH0_9NEIS
MNDSTNDVATIHSVVVRVLNGPLKGCEFLLQPGRTLFVVGDEATLESYQHALSSSTILIPLPCGGTNFEADFDATNDEAVLFRELIRGSTHEHRATFNTICAIGALKIAVRPAHTEWVAAVEHYEEPLVQQITSTVGPAPARWWLSGLAVVLCALCMMAALAWASSQRQPDQVQQNPEFMRMLAESNGRLHILSDANGQYYGFTEDERTASWARQTLLRMPTKQQMLIRTIEEEENRLEQWLAVTESGVQFFRIDLRTPDIPRVLLSQERNALSGTLRQKLRDNVSHAMPYAKTVQLLDISDDKILNEAQIGLERLALPYVRINTTNGVVYAIRGELNDGDLQSVRAFIKAYQRAWGQRFVQFSVELQDDKLKEKSYHRGETGYIKANPQHWSFLSIY